MSAPDGDSMWLQKSITIPDPLPEKQGETQEDTSQVLRAQEYSPPVAGPPGVMAPPPAEKPTASSEMDLTRMVLDTSGLVGSMQRPSTRYSTRMSVSNSAFISAHEFDELRARYSQAKRELLKISDTKKDLEFARFELTRSQEELKLMRQSNAALKRDVEEATERADKEHKMRRAAEAKMVEKDIARDKEVEFLRNQIEELRQENSRRISELSEQQENESQYRIRSLRDELAIAAEEMESLDARVREAQNEKDTLQRQLSAALSDVEEAKHVTEDLRKKNSVLSAQYESSEARHREILAQCEKEHELALRAQVATSEQHAQQITASKDGCIAELEAEVEQAKEKNRSLASESAALRHANQALTEEVRQLTADHAKELRRLTEEHRLAMCEKQLQMESSLREVKGSKVSMEEESQSLRRQLAKLSEELSSVAAVLAQRERQLSEMERDLGAAKESVRRLEQENLQLSSDVELNANALGEAEERIARINEQKDTLEDEFMRDLQEAKSKIRTLEESLMEARCELSALRTENIKSSDDARALVRDLRAELEEVTAECNSLQGLAAKAEENEALCQELRLKYLEEKQKADDRNVELSAAVSRCSALERKLEEELRRTIQSASRSPMITRQPKLRNTPSVNTRTPSSSLKRARTEDARVFAISGFDGSDLLVSIQQLPNVAVAECRSNMPVPPNLTHLVTNGQLTIKLLTALVRGCWILPSAYVSESLQQRAWLGEAEFGFQHSTPPLMKKRVALTDGFTASKHYSTASLLLSEGGALVVDDFDQADIVLCTNSELNAHERCMSWEKMVELIYPVRIE